MIAFLEDIDLGKVKDQIYEGDEYMKCDLPEDQQITVVQHAIHAKSKKQKKIQQNDLLIIKFK